MNNKENMPLNGGQPDEEQSTVFSTPPEHNDYKENVTKKRVLTLVGAVLGVAAAVGCIFAAIKLIPDKKSGTDKNSEVSVISETASKITGLSVASKDDSAEFYFEKNEETTSSETVSTNLPSTGSDSGESITWYMKDIEKRKVDSSLIRNFADSAVSLKGVPLESGEDALFGFDDPAYTVAVKTEENEYTVVFGDEMASGGRYMKVSGGADGIYSASADTVKALCKKSIDFASKTAYSQVEFKTDTSEYRNSGGALERFDSLTVSGTRYGGTYKFVMNDNAVTKNSVPYLVVTPQNAYAGNVDTLMKLYTDSLGVEGGYSYTATDSDLKEYGLDDPDYQFVLNIKGEEKTFKISITDSEYCAVLSDDFPMIRKVKIKYLPFKDLKTGDFYYSGLIPFEAKDIKTVSVKCGDISANLTVTADENSAVTVKNGDKTVKDFDTLISAIKGMSPVYKNGENAENGDCVFVFTLTDGTGFTLSFKKGDGTKYFFTAGDAAGRVTASAYGKLKETAEQILK